MTITSPIPQIKNDSGLKEITLSSKTFMCMGATPPFDHPHVYLTFDESGLKICPYCSTHFRYQPILEDDIVLAVTAE